jgi:hypothetical protein
MGMTGAAVVSTALFALPMALSPRNVSRTVTPAPIPPAAEQYVVVVAHDMKVGVDAPKLGIVRRLGAPALQRTAAAGQATFAKRADSARRDLKTTSLRGRFARLVAGDGRYSVRPFPSVGN